MSHTQTFEALRDAASATHDSLEAFYDTLPAVTRDAMIGDWEGGCFRTGHAGEAQLVALSWVGKTFRGENDVDPSVCRGKDGGRVASPVLGSASLRSVEHRGVVTATMVYDKHPIFDHFRSIDDATVLGCMDRKGEPQSLFFWLKRLG